MKIFNSHKASKSWSLDIHERDGDVFVSAVDSTSAGIITGIIRFSKDGDVCILPHVKMYLEDGGYDPYEHGNMFDTKGAVHICHIHLPRGV